MRLIFLFIVTVLLLTACGKKGALYLPDSTKPVATQSSAQ
ncbi:MAG: hypothetical protein COS39_11000 [Hydrogenophilales bacterium CG03_land_8_20_14_0_80_62_28]|nr:hypothetical protein [Betaproteobacteria bacterium]PIV21459.1 MAG: hypothetical protein COS39_11000 [Hydrogenophilales bacterium CG03_land_8_20_14_0_80_62_28]PIW39572.1 MAG: hypothetical protein COW23_00780 [Hydrogenophilales bacterium CG15_BIG_FIL_POST_REV_8_21_14_020_62_31]PIW71029.1 MAG: hypothetical protein COW07_10390 [Hydrogenophilales bacterium CG12_big_fil_rev_8_21_14_0_65_61_21]PIX02660.1 MAG: hypothetical protein COZ79_00535 [Hydrogenophilales bacterium CG_4_8_14_3_um_filter_62_83]